MSVNGIAEIDITTDSFLGVGAIVALVVVLGLVFALRTRVGRFSRLGRTIVVLVTTALVLLGAGAGINAHFDYFRTFGDVMGLPPSDEVELAVLLARKDDPTGAS